MKYRGSTWSLSTVLIFSAGILPRTSIDIRIMYTYCSAMSYQKSGVSIHIWLFESSQLDKRRPFSYLLVSFLLLSSRFHPNFHTIFFLEMCLADRNGSISSELSKQMRSHTDIRQRHCWRCITPVQTEKVLHFLFILYDRVFFKTNIPSIFLSMPGLGRWALVAAGENGRHISGCVHRLSRVTQPLILLFLRRITSALNSLIQFS